MISTHLEKFALFSHLSGFSILISLIFLLNSSKTSSIDCFLKLLNPNSHPRTLTSFSKTLKSPPCFFCNKPFVFTERFHGFITISFLFIPSTRTSSSSSQSTSLCFHSMCFYKRIWSSFSITKTSKKYQKNSVGCVICCFS